MHIRHNPDVPALSNRQGYTPTERYSDTDSVFRHIAFHTAIFSFADLDILSKDVCEAASYSHPWHLEKRIANASSATGIAFWQIHGPPEKA
jgi:hypothetical protein